jgi:ABC-type Fe3+ transport system substrate-binding protein
MRGALLAALFVGLLVAPLCMRRGGAAAAARAPREVVAITPSNEQIRFEFGRAFREWHERRYGEPAEVLWSTPGGAVEIRRMLVAAWESRLRQGLPVGGDADIVFGGGSYEFDALKKEVAVSLDGQTRSATILEPVALPAEMVRECYGMERLAGQRLFDAQGYWYGVALSTFGLVMNLDALETLGVPPLRTWSDLADPRLAGWVSLVNPAQSGSVLTAFETILQHAGWSDGVAILRRAAANARGFSAGSPRVAIDVADGDAAAGITIDFNARFQAQAMRDAAQRAGRPGRDARIVFVAPQGESSVDPDPVGMLRNAPHRETAQRFVEFCLSREAQRLWQLPAGSEGGPAQFELRRMPVMRALYRDEFARFMDPVDPLAIATPPRVDNPAMRAFLPILFQTMAIDGGASLREAWKAIVEHPAYPRGRAGLVRAADVDDPQLRAWLERFDALPMVPAPGGERPLSEVGDLIPLRDGWLRGQWRDQNLWPAQSAPADALRRLFGPFFQENYQWIVEQAARRKAA